MPEGTFYCLHQRLDVPPDMARRTATGIYVNVRNLPTYECGNEYDQKASDETDQLLADQASEKREREARSRLAHDLAAGIRTETQTTDEIIHAIRQMASDRCDQLRALNAPTVPLSGLQIWISERARTRLTISWVQQRQNVRREARYFGLSSSSDILVVKTQDETVTGNRTLDPNDLTDDWVEIDVPSPPLNRMTGVHVVQDVELIRSFGARDAKSALGVWSERFERIAALPRAEAKEGARRENGETLAETRQRDLRNSQDWLTEAVVVARRGVDADLEYSEMISTVRRSARVRAQDLLKAGRLPVTLDGQKMWLLVVRERTQCTDSRRGNWGGYEWVETTERHAYALSTDGRLLRLQGSTESLRRSGDLHEMRNTEWSNLLLGPSRAEMRLVGEVADAEIATRDRTKWSDKVIDEWASRLDNAEDERLHAGWRGGATSTPEKRSAPAPALFPTIVEPKKRRRWFGR